MTTPELQVLDMIDSNLPVSFNTDQSEVDVEYPDQVKSKSIATEEKFV